MNKFLKIAGSFLIIFMFGVGFYVNSQHTEIIKESLSKIEEISSEKLGVPVKINSVEFNNLNIFKLNENSDIIIHDVEIYDKSSELIAYIAETKVNLKILSLVDDPVAAIKEVQLDGVQLNLKRRNDNSWNINDINFESEGKTSFDAEVLFKGGTVNADFDEKNLLVELVSVEINCADSDAIITNIDAKVLGSQIKTRGVLNASIQFFDIEVDDINIGQILPYLPTENIPNNLEIHRGKIENLKLHVTHSDEEFNYFGTTEIKNAAIKVEQTDITDINASTIFNEREIFFDASAMANEQTASASGKIYLDTDKIFLNVFADASKFAPSAIINDIGIEGSADIHAHFVGTVENPRVDAEISAEQLSYQNLSAQKISTELQYDGDNIYFKNLSAKLFDGQFNGDVNYKIQNRSFNGKIRVSEMEGSEVFKFVGIEEPIIGKFSVDAIINGTADEIENLEISGSIEGENLNFKNLQFNEAIASFYFNENDLTIDYLSARLPKDGTFGLEGTINDLNCFDLKFYGAHIDMSLIAKLNKVLEMNGLSDFKGTLSGESINPKINLQFSAIDNSKHEGKYFVGKLFQQPFDSIQLSASGNLDEIIIDKFELEKDGVLKWNVIKGNISLSGTKKIDLQLETKDARAEDIAAFIAPDQEITGNVTNSIKITGTLDAPQIMGNIKFNRGSYQGILLNSIEGDYFLEGDLLNLQDVKVTSPMIDMILSGKINRITKEMDFVVLGNDIDLKRFESKFPENYIAEGHGNFEGIINGTLENPIFDGDLRSNEIVLNGVNLSDIYGHIELNGADISMNDFHFSDGDGNYQLQLSANINKKTLNWKVSVNRVELSNLLKIANKKNDFIEGKLNSEISLNSDSDKLFANIKGEIIYGAIAGYDIHDVEIDLDFTDNTINVNRFEGFQEDSGNFSMRGMASLDGVLSLVFQSKNIEFGMFSKLAGYDVNMIGKLNISTKIGGTINNPECEAFLTATGGINGSTFDLLRGHFILKDWLINVKELVVQRELGGKMYGATLDGIVPFRALNASVEEDLPISDQLNLEISLDEADLSLLPILSDYVAWGIGDLDGTLKITGSAINPKINGAISLSDGSVKIKGMNSLIEHINISTIFKEERFDIEEFTGNVGNGTFSLAGSLDFSNLELTDYNFDFEANNLNINSEFYDGLLNAKFNLCEGTLFKRKLPKLSGEINFENCLLSVPSLPDSEEALPNIILDISTNIGKDVRLYSSRLYDMYLTGNVKFSGTTRHPKTSGSINIERGGTLTYLESVFDIQEGEAYFNQIGSFLPSIHFYAETKISNIKIFLNIDGSPGNFKFKLSSSPEMSETEILRLLTLREAYSNGGRNLTAADALAIGLQMTVLADIEDSLKKILGIDQLTITRGSGSIFEKRLHELSTEKDQEQSYNVTIGKYINDKLMTRYTRGFGEHKVNRYGIQYDFNDNLGLTIEREGQDYIFSFEARYKF